MNMEPNRSIYIGLYIGFEKRTLDTHLSSSSPRSMYPDQDYLNLKPLEHLGVFKTIWASNNW